MITQAVACSSLDKWQVIWKVEGFHPDQAEGLQRSARPGSRCRSRGDRLRACSSSARFLQSQVRPTAFCPDRELGNRKLSSGAFPAVQPEDRNARATARSYRSGRPKAEPSQSELDWAFAKRALARGESPDVVIAAIASYRRFESRTRSTMRNSRLKRRRNRCPAVG
jgi:hypothetical protein